ncbi:MAG: CehA/McbA family metallohydrolase [Anaerolineales bacterium]
MLHEYAGNMHNHSIYSDGHGSHVEIARAAIQAGLDFIVVTDHNVWVDGMDGYRYLGKDRVLLLTGEEIHDQVRDPQKNHLLVFEARKELAPFAAEPQQLIDEVQRAGGLCFIAHPVDPAAPLFGESDLSWVDWDVSGYTGFEIWNFMSEFKSHLSSLPVAFLLAYSPKRSGQGPFPEVLERWDRLLASGTRIVAIGGADAHATPYRKGPFKRIVLPYEFLYRAVNTHVLTRNALVGDANHDRRLLFHSISRGRCFVGFDLPAPTNGFRFSAQGADDQVIMGDSIPARNGVTLQIKSPRRAEIRLIHNGEQLRRWKNRDTAVYTVHAPGAYRVEVHIDFEGRRCGWIYSNPIYVT